MDQPAQTLNPFVLLTASTPTLTATLYVEDYPIQINKYFLNHFYLTYIMPAENEA